MVLWHAVHFVVLKYLNAQQGSLLLYKWPVVAAVVVLIPRGVLFGGSRPPKQLTHGHASIVWGVYTPQITDSWARVKYLTDMHPSNILEG